MKLLTALVLATLLAPSAFAKDCKKGKPCGDTCISKDATCAADKGAKKECKKGKPCGDTCISKDATCSK